MYIRFFVATTSLYIYEQIWTPIGFWIWCIYHLRQVLSDATIRDRRLQNWPSWTNWRKSFWIRLTLGLYLGWWNCWGCQPTVVVAIGQLSNGFGDWFCNSYCLMFWKKVHSKTFEWFCGDFIKTLQNPNCWIVSRALHIHNIDVIHIHISIVQDIYIDT